MSEKAGGPKKVKLIFVGGRSAPRGMVEGRVYLLSERCENFAWFVRAPEESEVGKRIPIIGRTAAGAVAIEGVGAVSAVTDTSIPFEYNIKVEMQFIGGTMAPGVVRFGSRIIKKGDKIMLPLRYARKAWWKLVHPLPDSLKVPPMPEAESVIDTGPRMPDEVFNRALMGGLGREVPLEREPPAAVDVGDLTGVPGLVDEVREPVEITPGKLESGEDAQDPLAEEALREAVDQERDFKLEDTRAKLMDMTVKDLRVLAKGQNLKDYNLLRKTPLVDAILAASKPTPVEDPASTEASEEA